MIKEEICYTCKRPYDKTVISFCSSTFHCCKDCKWNIEDYMGFKAHKLVEWCDYCKEKMPEGYADWLKK